MHSRKSTVNYVINFDTLVLQPVKEGYKLSTRVIERHSEFTLPKKPLQIVKKTCELYGASLQTRTLTARQALGNRHKTPIVIAHAFNTPYIFLPTMSPKAEENMWISSHAILDFQEEEVGCTVVLENGYEIKLNVSTPTMWRQLAFASLLEKDFNKKQGMLHQSRTFFAQEGPFRYPIVEDND
ncbi:competence protein ComK [Sporosarcina aquimarina]|uniref:Competence protein ComK n=1 Tax=Sporosarcina aquimarina TaxID=114975 RepID=A0ABU4G391_9BACL|nr:competence protein ComK [Sporosarcina aquimarina]MDW0110783.1 competence protein ComK [Sporosarcina aquimarina]